MYMHVPFNCADYAEAVLFEAPAGAWLVVALPPGVWCVCWSDTDVAYVAPVERGIDAADVEGTLYGGVTGPQTVYVAPTAGSRPNRLLVETTLTHTIAVRGSGANSPAMCAYRYESPNLIAAASGSGRRFDPYEEPLR